MLKDRGFFKVINFCALAILITAFVLFFLNVSLWDYDFWWHIATGRYIVETGALPETDPLSYTSILEENKNQFAERDHFILQQYWLSQVILYLIYDNTGAAGIIILRALLLTLTLLIVLWRLQRWSVSFPVSFIFIFVLYMLLTRSTGERPVLFTIFFTPLIFFILEDFKDKKDKRIFFVMPLMLLWANLHGGFILGIVILMVFMLGESLKIAFKKTTFTRQEISFFYSATVLAIGCSYLNPTGWDAFPIAISSKYEPFYRGIQEYTAPFLFYKNKIYPMLYEYIFFLVMSLIILIVRNKKLELTHIALLSGVLIMSISTSRYISYFGIIAAMITGRESDKLFRSMLKARFQEKTAQKILNVLTVVSLFSAIFFIIGIYRSDTFRFKVSNNFSVPVAAVDFIEKNKLSGNMFNSEGYGGYIAWRLNPAQKTFSDTRGLNIMVRTEYSWIISATDLSQEDNSKPNISVWKKLLNHYKINFMLLSPVDMYGEVLPIVFSLAESNAWVPVYCDPISVIFIKNTAINRDIIEKFKLSKDDVYNTIIFRSSFNAMNDKINPRYLISLGETFYKMNRISDAVKAYEYALKRMPEDTSIKERYVQIKSELKP